jgi:hypothetical protein
MLPRFERGNPDLWHSVGVLVDTWRKLSVVRLFNASLPQNARPHANRLTDAVQMGFAAGGGLLANPLRIHSLLPMALSLQPEEYLDELRREYPAWWEAARRVELASFEALNWIRSQLPGFPMIPAPQLAANSPLTTHEYTRKEPWPLNLQSLGLGSTDVPSEVLKTLGTNPEEGEAVLLATRALLHSLQDSPQWRRLADLMTELSGEDIKELMAAKRRIRERLQPDAVDGYEDTRAMLRDTYRIRSTELELSKLPSKPGEFAAAFEEAELLAEDVASVIFGQLVCVGIYEVNVEELEVRPGPSGSARFRLSTDGFRFPQIGDLVWLRDPLLADAVFITSVSFNFNQLDGELVQVRGSILSGSGAGLARLGHQRKTGR